MGLLDQAYDELRKPRAMGLRVGDFVPYVSGLLAADDARQAVQQGNYGEAAGALAGFIPAGRLVEKAVKGITGGKSTGQVGDVREIFAGRKAKNADLAAADRAEARLARGDDPRQVWQDEGWFRGADGKMRFEIDDSPSALGKVGSDRLRGGYMAKLPSLLEHGDLFDSYPSMKDIAVTKKGLPKKKGQELGADYDDEASLMRFDFPTQMTADRKNELRSSALHEAQHAVQSQEGFSLGANPDIAYVDEANYLPIYKQKLLDKQAGKSKYPTEEAEYEWYRRQLGETEARAVEARMGMSKQERRLNYPVDSYDVPVDQLIYKSLLD